MCTFHINISTIIVTPHLDYMYISWLSIREEKEMVVVLQLGEKSAKAESAVQEAFQHS